MILKLKKLKINLIIIIMITPEFNKLTADVFVNYLCW